MNAYMAHEKDMQCEGAMLVFAQTARRARAISHNLDWACCDYIDWVATRLRDLPEHLKLLDDGSEQVITAPPAYPSCGWWGYKLIGDGCEACRHEGGQE
jgi:hypothetical protein